MKNTHLDLPSYIRERISLHEESVALRREIILFQEQLIVEREREIEMIAYNISRQESRELASQLDEKTRDKFLAYVAKAEKRFADA